MPRFKAMKFAPLAFLEFHVKVRDEIYDRRREWTKDGGGSVIRFLDESDGIVRASSEKTELSR
jgi:hypothetical protein